MWFFWAENCCHFSFTPWKFNIAPENIPSQKESSRVFQPAFFRGYVKLREGILLSLPLRTRHLVMFFSFLAPRPPRNSETPHTGHTSTYHAAQTSQGIAIRLWGKLLEAYPWGDGLWKTWDVKKKVDWCVFFEKIHHPQFTRRDCIAIYSNYVCVCAYIGIVVWKSLKLHHPSQIRCEFEGIDLSDGKKCAKKKCLRGDITKVN